MHNYDTVLKSLLTESENSPFHRITGAGPGRWLNVELPRVNQPRVDLLSETSAVPRRLFAMELLSANDRWLPVRMAEYSLSVYRTYEIFPAQYALYVGSQTMRMPSALDSPNYICRYTLINIRDLDVETFLSSPFPSEAILAILARHANPWETFDESSHDSLSYKRRCACRRSPSS